MNITKSRYGYLAINNDADLISTSISIYGEWAQNEIWLIERLVKPGDIVHMDQCGACKFPADQLAKVLEYATGLIGRESREKAFFQDSSFTLEKWKASA